MISCEYSKIFRETFFMEQFRRLSTQWDPLNEIYLRFKFDVSSLFHDWRYIDFETGHFFDLSSSKLMVILLTLGKSKLTLLVHFNGFGQATVILLSLGKTLGPEKQFKLSPFDKKFKNHAWDLAQVIFNDSISGNQELGSQLINKLQRFNLLFLFVTRFF